MNKLLQGLMLSATLAFAGSRADAQSLPFDSSFGDNGVVNFDFLPAYNVIDIALQRDGKILCLYGSSSYTYMLRVNSDGSMDNTFMGGDGYIFYAPFPTPVRGVWQIGGKLCETDGSLIKQMYDDKILGVFSGYAVTRLKVSGTTDSAFGNSSIAPGFLDINANSPAHPVNFIYDAFDAHEAGIYYASRTSMGATGLTDTLLIAKSTKDGDIVTSFGDGGIMAIPLDTVKFGYINEIYECVYAQDGKLIVTGSCYRRDYAADGRDMFVARFNQDGTLDNTFGTGGVNILDIDHEQQTPAKIAIGADGSIYVNGISDVIAATSPRYFNVKYNAAGVQDAAYGTSGIIIRTPPATAVSAYPGSMAITSYGKAYMSCLYTVGFMDWRDEYFSFNANGTANTQFAAGGVTNPLGAINNDSYDKAFRMLTQPDNKILIMGAGDVHPKLMRITGDEAPVTAVSEAAAGKLKLWVAEGNAYISGLDTGENMDARLMSADGRIMTNWNADNLIKMGSTGILQLPDGLTPGMYILSVQTREGRQQVKFIY